MTRPEALQLALGYAWASEDATDVKTATTPEWPGNGPIAFAEAFADAWEDYNTGRRGHMINVADAYKSWQATDGHSIFGVWL